LAAEQIAADDPVRDATKQQMLEVIERVIWLLTS